jgi:hypothetical protein
MAKTSKKNSLKNLKSTQTWNYSLGQIYLHKQGEGEETQVKLPSSN